MASDKEARLPRGDRDLYDARGMPEGVVKGSWTPCPKAKVEGGREAPQCPKAKVRPAELRSTLVSPKAKLARPLTVTGRKGGGVVSAPMFIDTL